MKWSEAKKNKDATYGEYGYSEPKTKVYDLDDLDMVMKDFVELCKKCGFAMSSSDEDEEAKE